MAGMERDEDAQENPYRSGRCANEKPSASQDAPISFVMRCAYVALLLVTATFIFVAIELWYWQHR